MGKTHKTFIEIEFKIPEALHENCRHHVLSLPLNCCEKVLSSVKII